MRVYELAKICGVPSKDMLIMLQQLNFAVESHMSVLPEGAADAVQKKIQLTQVHSTTPSPSVVSFDQNKQMSSGARLKPEYDTKRFSDREKTITTSREELSKTNKSPVTHLVRETMTLGEFSERTGYPLGEIIATLLRQGKVVNKNQLLSEEMVGTLMRMYGLVEQESASSVTPTVETPDKVVPKEPKVSVGGIVRQPIVVVMGHVDHGKTTLLDTIRKTRVAAREKGGITQHLGAYEAVTEHGKITFLDTPGHAAFSMIRSRGAKIADIAILVVAADDGPKPQTVEALKVAQTAGIPIIVALNKIDRATPAQIEVVKRDLTQWGLVPEDWGGDTSMVPISAKSGQGVDLLLEAVALQAHVMDLNAPTNLPAHGFVIESSVQRGLGPIATVIVRKGTLRVGDYIVVGATHGRVTALIDVRGVRIREAGPALPVLVAGFESRPDAGDELDVLSGPSEARLMRDKEPIASDIAKKMANMSEKSGETQLLVLKADTASSLEAIVMSLKKMASTLGRPIQIVQQGVGPISEGDITTAITTHAILYGLHVKWEPRAQVYAQRERVQVRLFDIIYKLLDDITTLAQKQQRVEKILKKVGEAVVLKVFEIKKMGTIAGAQVKSGLFSRDGVVKVFRGKGKAPIGEGRIESLQRDRKTVKEVHAGFECAFLVQGFHEWQPDDRVECYLPVLSNV